MAVTADGRARLLADGDQVPMLGLGVWRARPGGLILKDMRRTAAPRYPQQARTARRTVRPA